QLYKSMKNLILIAMTAVALTIFNGCQKDELGVSQLADEVQPQEVVQPDVYVENGYLAFKDLNALDSLIKVLNTMTPDEINSWENSIGFISARTYYSPIFKESERISSFEEMVAFKEKYKNVLKWNKLDSNDYTFDYPFYKTGLVPVMNKDGIFKIGRSLVKYAKDKKIIIADGDTDKVELALSLNKSTDGIIIYNHNDLLKSSSEHFTITYFTDDYPPESIDGSYIRWSSSRKMQNKFAYEAFTYKLYNGLWEGGYQVYLRQNARKKTWGIWVNYYTVYKVSGLTYKKNGVTLFTLGSYTSPETKPYNFIYIDRTITASNVLNEPSIPVPYPLDFACSSTCRGFDYYPIGIDYVD
ncbi:MAG: DUF4848 domain-containing protein, partial [Bacteroidales bacterium]|nr:DUF4848 domain-containing protein [Bacteroidales bacterium]